MIAIVDEAPEHFGVRETLLDQSFGPDRFLKTSERLRADRLPVFAFSALDDAGKLVGTVRLWAVSDPHGCSCLMLGPLAVSVDCRGQRVGDRLMRHALNQAAVHGHGSVLLVGDLPYYSRFGFQSGVLDQVSLPGPVVYDRFLGLELAPGHLSALTGQLSASGVMNPISGFVPIADDPASVKTA